MYKSALRKSIFRRDIKPPSKGVPPYVYLSENDIKIQSEIYDSLEANQCYKIWLSTTTVYEKLLEDGSKKN